MKLSNKIFNLNEMLNDDEMYGFSNMMSCYKLSLSDINILPGKLIKEWIKKRNKFHYYFRIAKIDANGNLGKFESYCTRFDGFVVKQSVWGKHEKILDCMNWNAENEYQFVFEVMEKCNRVINWFNDENNDTRGIGDINRLIEYYVSHIRGFKDYDTQKELYNQTVKYLENLLGKDNECFKTFNVSH